MGDGREGGRHSGPPEYAGEEALSRIVPPGSTHHLRKTAAETGKRFLRRGAGRLADQEVRSDGAQDRQQDRAGDHRQAAEAPTDRTDVNISRRMPGDYPVRGRETSRRLVDAPPGS